MWIVIAVFLLCSGTSGGQHPVVSLDIPPRWQVNAPDIPPRSQVNFPDILPRSQVNFPDILPRSQVNFPDILPRSQVSIPDLLPRSQGNFPDIFPRSQVNAPERNDLAMYDVDPVSYRYNEAQTNYRYYYPSPPVLHPVSNFVPPARNYYSEYYPESLELYSVSSDAMTDLGFYAQYEPSLSDYYEVRPVMQGVRDIGLSRGAGPSVEEEYTRMVDGRHTFRGNTNSNPKRGNVIGEGRRRDEPSTKGDNSPVTTTVSPVVTDSPRTFTTSIRSPANRRHASSIRTEQTTPEDRTPTIDGFLSTRNFGLPIPAAGRDYLRRLALAALLREDRQRESA